MAGSCDGEAIRAWFADLMCGEGFALEHMALADSPDWALRDGTIRHRSGRFFSVVGVAAVHADGRVVEQPMLDQREVGTLAFILRQRGGRPELLVQAKVEPGNVGPIQLAPSFQATASNAARAHGGAWPPLHDWFDVQGRGTVLADGLHSEQGTRFFGKRNRNCTLQVAGEVAHGEYHRWIGAAELCALLAEDHLVNTDARSVLVCSSWEALAAGRPFAGAGFAEELRASHELPDGAAWRPFDDILSALGRPAPWRESPGLRPVDRLDGWRMGVQGPEPLAGGPFRLRHVHVRARSREVPAWDQPIVESAGQGEVVLPVGRWRGTVHFLFRIVSEPGFGARLELTPAVAREPGGDAGAEPFITALLAGGRELVACVQSEEGGRFLRDQNRYALVDVGAAVEPAAGYGWLSLAQVRRLLVRGETLTNEARSALSLLLAWL
jgi:oxidase EvaA